MFANQAEEKAFYAKNCERCTSYVSFVEYMETKKPLCPIENAICNAAWEGAKKFPYQHLTESPGPEKYRCKELKPKESEG